MYASSKWLSTECVLGLIWHINASVWSAPSIVSLPDHQLWSACKNDGHKTKSACRVIGDNQNFTLVAFSLAAWRDGPSLDLLGLEQHRSELNTDWFAVKALLFFSSLVHTTMKSALTSLTSERERLKQCLDHETCPPTSPQVVGLKNALATVRETTRTQTQ